MRNILKKGFLIAMLFATGKGYAQRHNTGIHFNPISNWQQLLNKAKSEHKYIFVDVFTTWCVPCRMMDMNVYAKDEIGKLVNTKFISVKMQVDSTKNDEEEVKAFRAEAKKFAIKYRIEGYPTFLFFDEDGNLVNRDIGLKSIQDFRQLVSVSSNPDFNYLKLIAQYRSGKINYQLIPDLIRTAQQLKNNALADSLSIDFKKYLDELPYDKLINRSNLTFLSSHSNLIRLNDPTFRLCYQKPDVVDSILNMEWGKPLVRTVIQRDLIINQYLTNNNKIKGSKPNWRQLAATINKQYPRVDTVLLMLNAKLEYYARLKDWGNYSVNWTRHITIFPPGNGLESIVNLNNKAWDLFNQSNDKVALENALIWCDLDLINRPLFSDHVGTIDTKANLLYKLGKVDEAIRIEEKGLSESQALDANSKFKGRVFLNVFIETLAKMKKGLPTWPETKP